MDIYDLMVYKVKRPVRIALNKSSSSSEGCPLAKRCHFYVLRPSVSVLCPSQGHAWTKVQREQVSRDASRPGLSRTSNRPLPGSLGGPSHCLQSSRVVQLCIAARNVAEELEAPAQHHLKSHPHVGRWRRL